AHFVVQRLPVTGEHVRARDDDVDFLGSGRYRGSNLVYALLERVEPRGETGRDGRDGDVRAGEGLHRRRHERVIDAHGADLDVQVRDAERVDEVRADGAPRFGAEPDDVPRGVVALERRQVHAGDRAEQPRGLPFLLDGAARGDRGRAPLHRAAV